MASFDNRADRQSLRRLIAPLAVAAVIAAGVCGQARAQGAPQTVGIMKVDPATLATGFRSSKIVGSSVVNEANETVGSIDDLIVKSQAQQLRV